MSHETKGYTNCTLTSSRLDGLGWAGIVIELVLRAKGKTGPGLVEIGLWMGKTSGKPVGWPNIKLPQNLSAQH